MPPLFCLSLGALGSLLLAVLLLEQRLDNLTERQNQNYGAALARMAAQQGIDAALNHDLVSLQVILQDVAAYPGVLLATMHDVENNLLVQAGNASYVRNTDERLSLHTAPITLHDSVAGYVTVTLAPPVTQRAAVLSTAAAIAALLALIAGLSLYEHRARAFTRVPHRRAKIAEPLAQPATHPDLEADAANMGDESVDEDYLEGDDDYGDEEHGETMDDEPRRAFALLRVDTERLRQQLTSDLLATTLEKMDQLLDDVLALYSGRAIDRTSREGEYLLQFDSTESHAEAIFRAACSVALTMRLAAHLQPVAPTPGATLSLDTTALMEPSSPSPGSELLIDRAAVEDSVLQQRLILAEVPARPEQYRLQDFQQPFAALLDRQYQQLCKWLD